MGIFYVLAGIAHFVRTDAYMPMMPPYLPAHRELVLLSGVAEVRRHSPTHHARRLVRQLQLLGYRVTFEPLGAAA
jgi:hypothetical protein